MSFAYTAEYPSVIVTVIEEITTSIKKKIKRGEITIWPSITDISDNIDVSADNNQDGIKYW